jgi:hypothetical protein
MDSASKPTIQLGPIRIDFLVDADDSGGSVTVFECFIPTGSKVPLAGGDAPPRAHTRPTTRDRKIDSPIGQRARV